MISSPTPSKPSRPPSFPSMAPRLRPPSSSSRDDRLLRYLRPGALARLRDSRLSARSLNLRLRLAVSAATAGADSASGASSDGSPQIDGIPCLSPARACGPRFPQRKKLAASKAVFLGRLVASDGVVDVVNVDLLWAR